MKQLVMEANGIKNKEACEQNFPLPSRSQPIFFKLNFLKKKIPHVLQTQKYINTSGSQAQQMK